MKPLLNIDDISLDKPSLIEASAGTGKTYTLAELFIRALKEVPEATVESILVVTFTNAAAAELRGRLHARLLEERAKVPKTSGDEFKRWNDALLMFDKAGITTIHGFCERMLAEFAFEGALPFNTVLDDSSGTVVGELVFDYWRQKIYSGEINPEVIRECGMFTPGEIAALTAMSIAKPLARVEPKQAQIDKRSIAAVEELRRQFPADAAKLGIRASAKKQLADFDALRALFDDPNWAQMPDELKVSRVLRSSQSIVGAASKGFAEVQVFLGEIEAGFIPLRIRMMVEARNELAKPDGDGLTKVGREIRRHGVRTFDDILNDLRLMLESSPSAVDAMRKKFKIAMIDEFQDTDPVQWRIFHKVFMEGPEPHRIIVVGDPKQAIYSFRGGDIDTYCSVRDEITRVGGSVWTLTTNYRSEPSAVDAVNRVFLSKDADKPNATFEKREGSSGIGYIAIDAKTAKADMKSISLLQRADSEPLCDPSVSTASGVVIKKLGSGASNEIAADVIAEIRTLLNSNVWKIFRYEKDASGVWSRGGGRAVRPGDLCILSNSNNTARIFHDKLCLNSIPCTIRTEKSVFSEEEAGWINSLLTVAMSSARKGFGSLLATPMFDLEPSEIVKHVEGRAEGLVDYAAIIRAERGKLDAHGIQSYFASIAELCGIKHRLLGGSLGERHWTNLSQVIEVLGNVAKTNHLTPEALQDWLEEAIADSGEKAAEYEFRLDSDAESVTSMTIHKSKGLEFPVVFIPEFDKGNHRVGEVGTFHRAGETIISCKLDAEGVASKTAESLEESIRKLYVAVTRAVHRTYLYIDDRDYTQGRDANGVMGHLLSTGQVFQIPDEELKDGTVTVQKKEDGAAPNHELRITNSELADSCVLQPRKDDAVTFYLGQNGESGSGVSPLNEQSRDGFATMLKQRRDDTPIRSYRSELAESFVAHALTLVKPCEVSPIAKPWIVTSFSGIKEGLKGEEIEVVAHEGASEAGDDESVQAEKDPNDPTASSRPARYTLGGGTVFGNAIHSVFEACPFDAEIDVIREHIDKQLNAWHLPDLATDDEAKNELARMVHDTLHAPIPDASGNTFTLVGIPETKRRCELAFYFPLPDGKSTETLLTIFRSWGGIYAQSLVGIGAVDRMLRGMLKGYIDLIFEHDGKYYIADWKTNKMDGDLESFEIDPAHPQESRIAKEIAHSQYALQWALYAVALHRHLQNTLHGYDYATHFGGVRYCFVRGMSPARPGAGVWVQTLPPPEAMAALDGFFGATRE